MTPLNNLTRTASPASATLFATSSIRKISSEPSSRAPSRASTLKSRTTGKHSIQDVFEDEMTKDNEMSDCMGIQKHKHALVELELKCHKLENWAIEKQHQREREREQHEIHMIQLCMMLAWQSTQTMPLLPSFEGLGFMRELNDPTLPSTSYPS